MYTTNFELVGDFMEACDQDVLASPVFPEEHIQKLRLDLIEEELDEESTEKRNLVMSSAEVKPHMEKISNLKSNKAFSGIHDVIDWVMTQTKDETNTLADATLYIDHLVVNRLYTDLFLKIE